MSEDEAFNKMLFADPVVGQILSGPGNYIRGTDLLQWVWSWGKPRRAEPTSTLLLGSNLKFGSILGFKLSLVVKQHKLKWGDYAGGKVALHLKQKFWWERGSVIFYSLVNRCVCFWSFFPSESSTSHSLASSCFIIGFLSFQYLEGFLVLNSNLLNWTRSVSQKNEENIICNLEEHAFSNLANPSSRYLAYDFY